MCRVGAPTAMVLFGVVGLCTLVEHGWKFAELRNARYASRFVSTADLELSYSDTCAISNVTYNIQNDKPQGPEADFAELRIAEYVDEHAIPLRELLNMFKNPFTYGEKMASLRNKRLARHLASALP